MFSTVYSLSSHLTVFYGSQGQKMLSPSPFLSLKEVSLCSLSLAKNMVGVKGQGKMGLGYAQGELGHVWLRKHMSLPRKAWVCSQGKSLRDHSASDLSWEERNLSLVFQLTQKNKTRMSPFYKCLIINDAEMTIYPTGPIILQKSIVCWRKSFWAETV